MPPAAASLMMHEASPAVSSSFKVSYNLSSASYSRSMGRSLPRTGRAGPGVGE
jgi:hypothetical protein